MINKVAIIQARMGSTRLPGKVLRKVNTVPLLKFQLDRINQALLIDQTIVATSNSKNDDIIAEFCETNDILCFRGSENDVLDRYYQCAKHYKADAMTLLITAHLLGAVIIEKHFTHDKTLPGNDHYHAMDVNDLKRFVELIAQIHVSLGPDRYKKPIETEDISRLNARRSIVLSQDIKAGTKLTEGVITYKRPGTGITPHHWDKVIGRKINRDLKGDHILTWSDLK